MRRQRRRTPAATSARRADPHAPTDQQRQPVEARFGFSRAVRVGAIVTVAVGDVAQQARRCVEIIAAALAQTGAGLQQVVRTRVLLLHIEDWPPVAPVHGAYFAAIRPVTTVLPVARFIDPQWLVEFEADAVLEQTP